MPELYIDNPQVRSVTSRVRRAIEAEVDTVAQRGRGTLILMRDVDGAAPAQFAQGLELQSEIYASAGRGIVRLTRFLHGAAAQMAREDARLARVTASTINQAL